jgi:hypothetical protein
MREVPRYFSGVLILLVILVSSCSAEDRLPSNAHADRVLVLKKDRTLSLLDHGKVLKKYKIALGRTSIGPKL